MSEYITYNRTGYSSPNMSQTEMRFDLLCASIACYIRNEHMYITGPYIALL